MVKCNLTGYIKQVPKQIEVCRNINEPKMLQLIRKGSWRVSGILQWFPVVVSFFHLQLT